MVLHQYLVPEAVLVIFCISELLLETSNSSSVLPIYPLTLGSLVASAPAMTH